MNRFNAGNFSSLVRAEVVRALAPTHRHSTSMLVPRPGCLYSEGMTTLLMAWLGQTDLDAAKDEAKVGAGPVARALEDRVFDAAILLNTYPEAAAAGYLEWLRARVGHPAVEIRQVQLDSPVDYGAIYRNAVDAVEDARRRHDGRVELTFHLSPGTPAMAAVWVLLAKARYGARLVDSSKAHGVRDVEVPFSIAAEFLPDLLREEDRRLSELAAALPPEAPEFDQIVHRSAAMRQVVACARMVAPRTVPVLVEGESGTGKELLARAIHAASPRARRRMVAVNCGAIPENLVESVLFGHVKGAFTGADRAQKGLFAGAHQSTLFLDEVGELTPAAQVKLLRALEEGTITPVGSTEPVAVDVRVIAATNCSLVEEVGAGRFRSDLYYRLAVAVLTLPPLRSREGDLGLLVDHVLALVNRAQGDGDPAWQDKKLSAGARKLVLNHPWPGNVRELVNTLTRSVVWCPGPTVREQDVSQAFLPAVGTRRETVLDRPLGHGLDLRELLSEVARHYLTRAMTEAQGNKTRAAELVGLPSYQTLTNWLERYGVEG